MIDRAEASGEGGGDRDIHGLRVGTVSEAAVGLGDAKPGGELARGWNSNMER